MDVAVLDEFDQEASLEDIHAIFSIPENTYDAETLKEAVLETSLRTVLLTLLVLYLDSVWKKPIYERSMSETFGAMQVNTFTATQGLHRYRDRLEKSQCRKC